MTIKFAMPGLKEGSIFEVEYVSRCSFIVQDLDWPFQHKYPCLWSKYDLTMPDAYLYSIKYQGDSSFYTHIVETVTTETIAPQSQGKLLMSHFRWIKKDETALTPEPFIASLRNYEDKVSFYHRWYMRSFSTYKTYTSDSWEGFSHIYFILNGIEDFEDDKFSWLKKDLEQITAGLQTKSEISLTIYKYIRDQFTCLSHNDYFMSKKLRETFRDRSGTVADLNLLLTAMLKQMHIDARPALLTTLDKGFGNLIFPLPDDYNYLICVADVDGRQVLLDASQPLNA